MLCRKNQWGIQIGLRIRHWISRRAWGGAGVGNGRTSPTRTQFHAKHIMAKKAVLCGSDERV